MASYPFYLTNSMLRDWKNMCPLEFKAKWFDKSIKFKTTEAMMWGNYFETLVIGSTVHGTVQDIPAEYRKLVSYDRVRKQAEKCKSYIKMLGGKPIGRQVKSSIVFQDMDGNDIPIEGTWDMHYEFPDGKKAIIDTKLTISTDNDFGEFQWGNLDKNPMTQLIHYSLLHRLQLQENCEAYYFVFDYSAKMKEKLIRVNISDDTYREHIEALSAVYNEISLSLKLDDWQPKNTYKNCSNCKLKELLAENGKHCQFECKMPEIIDVSK